VNLLCSLIPIGYLCGAPEGPADLAAFDGKSPFEEVEDTRFLNVPRIRKSIELFGGDLSLIDVLDAGTDITLKDGALIVTLCDREKCGEANAALAVEKFGGVIALCTFEKPGPAKWIGPLLKRKSSPDTCPQDTDAFVDAYAAMRE
jgi:hypothetical protein